MKPTRHDPSSTRRTRDTTFQLLAGVRRRLWLEAISRGALRGAWLGAALAGLGAAVHLALWEHAMTPVLLVAAAVLAAPAVVAAARRRPSLERAAARGDAWFGGGDLLSSAVFLLARRPSERLAAAQFVLESANDRARIWLLGLRPLGASVRFGRFFVPCAMFASFSFLYGLPGARSAEPAGAEVAVASGARVAPVAVRLPGAPGDPMRADAGPSVWARAADSRAEDGFRSSHDFSGRPADPDRASGSSAAVAGSAAGRGDEAGRAAGGEAKAGASEPARFLAVRFVELAASAVEGRDATGSGAGRELKRMTGDSPEAGPVPDLRTGSPSIVGRGAIQPALRAYVAEYGRKIRELE